MERNEGENGGTKDGWTPSGMDGQVYGSVARRCHIHDTVTLRPCDIVVSYLPMSNPGDLNVCWAILTLRVRMELRSLLKLPFLDAFYLALIFQW